MKRRKHQKFRSRGGIRLPAAITLCLALSLLIFSRAGGEPIAQKALTGLARNSGFVTRATAFFSSSAFRSEDTAEVYTPRTAAAARDEQAANPSLQRAPMCPRPTPRTTIRCCRPLTRLPRSPSTTRPRMTWMRQTVRAADGEHFSADGAWAAGADGVSHTAA